ncbi:hypothetical protein IWQ56_000173 [Coemansia nantahalensis]|nr:hypothetical protein IWQ56_000173 [Coemansia nantahalensis]
MWFCKEAQYELAGRVAVVTGALGAIGRRLAARLAESGAQVALVDIGSESDGAALCAELNSGRGQRVAAYRRADLRDAARIAELLAWADGEFGRVDVVVNNAGLASPHGLYSGGETADRMAALLQVNLLAPMEMMRAFAEYARAHGRPSVVVNMASMGGLVPNEGGEVYGAAKAALVHLTRASRSLMPAVRVCAVAPYYVDTPMVRNNPKLQNNPTVYPALMLSVDAVCDATLACIRDPRSAGRTVALIGSASARMWMYDVVGVHIKLLGAWSLAAAAFWRLLGY